MKTSNHRYFEDLSVADIELLSQAWERLQDEGYEPGFSFRDFLDMIVCQGKYAREKLKV